MPLNTQPWTWLSEAPDKEQTEAPAIMVLIEEESVDPQPDVEIESAFLPFETHEDAFSTLEQIGYGSVRDAPSFTSEDLVDEVVSLLQKEGITVLDMPSTIPSTSSAAYQALTVSAFTASASCRKDTNAAFIIMRTAENTPSFLFGDHWSAAQSFGKETADKNAKEKQTPFLYIFYQSRQMCVPSSIFHAGKSITAKVVAQQITGNDSYFCCSICGNGFISTGKGGDIQIEEVAVSASGKTFKRHCVMDRIEKGDTSSLF